MDLTKEIRIILKAEIGELWFITKFAKELNTLFNEKVKGYYPKEFIFWMNNNLREYRFTCDKTEAFWGGEWRNIDSLFTYWQTEINK